MEIRPPRAPRAPVRFRSTVMALWPFFWAAAFAAPGAFSAEDAGEPAAPLRLPALEDIDGRSHPEPSRSGASEPIIVLAWTGADCPMAKLYLPRLRRLAAEFGGRGVRFYLINSNSLDDPAEVRRAAGEVPEGLAVIRDADGALARLAGARTTTEAIVLDRERRVVYRGAADDQYGFRRRPGRGAGTYRKEAPERHYLRDAIEAALAGKEPSPQATDPLGCALEWAAGDATGTAASAPRDEDGITFHGRIEPILRKRCQGCHRSGGSAPFPLEEYGQARGWRRMIREVVSERRMPPWGANPAHGRFQNDPSLSEEEIAAIARWVEAGAPRGDPAGAPPRRSAPAAEEAEPDNHRPDNHRPDNHRPDIGRPDAAFTTPAFDVPAEGTLPYRYVRVRTRSEEDRWIEAYQIHSSTPQLVHHVLVFLENVGPPPPGSNRPWRPPFNPFSLLEGAKPEEYGQWIHRFRDLIRRDLMIGQGGGLYSYLASSSSGDIPRVFPSGRAKLLPAGATLVFQIHYTPDGEARSSETTLAVRFSKEPPRHAVDTGAISTVAFAIPPGAGEHVVQATTRFLRDGLLLSMRPHMHVRGKSFRYVAELPGGGEEILLDVPRWDFDWQLDYVLAEPRLLPRGTVLRAIGTYDNSDRNPYNPDPAKEVYFGLQTDDEMMIGYFDVIWLGQDSEAGGAPGGEEAAGEPAPDAPQRPGG